MISLKITLFPVCFMFVVFGRRLFSSRFRLVHFFSCLVLSIIFVENGLCDIQEWFDS